MKLTRLLTFQRSRLLMVMLGGLALYEVALAAGGGDSGHGGAVLNVLLELIVILLAAKLGGDLFERVSQPAVLGELIIGMLIGNAHLIGIDLFQGFGSNLTLEILAELGVIILLFEVGLESTVREMRQVGLTSLLVAVLGVIAPFFLGWGVSIIFLPEESELVHAFIGATLCATSVGITARVLKDIGKTSSRESKIILGAAVIDDVLGLVILAIVSGIITAASTGQDGISAGQVSWIIGKALIFIVGAIVVGQWLLPKYFKLAIRVRGKGVFLSFALLICFGLAYVAGKIGLAPIVGAFAAGLIYDRIEYQEFEEREKHTMEELISPIAIFLVPIFFVRMGMLVDLTTFAQVEILGFAAVLTIAAIIGKQACSLGIWDKQTNRFAVGLGMIPRGEVGLIFAGIGAKLMLDGHAVISASTYSAVVIMVIITTLVTPPLLKWSMMRRSS
ncbi:MAG: cation:proton antiporter [bacterium]|nr:cation:proton antiporter [bacterium]